MTSASPYLFLLFFIAAHFADTIHAYQQPNEKIVFYSERDGNANIYSTNVDGQNLQQLTTDSADDVCPAFSPDGSKIAFVSERDGNSEIYVMSSDGKGIRRVTKTNSNESHPSWSPDGKQLLFFSTRDENADIFVVGLDGENERRLTTNKATEMRPTWSPDGSKIAFNSDRDGQIEIYVMDKDGSNQTRITSGKLEKVFPVWSPDGERIAFMLVDQKNTRAQVGLIDKDGKNQKILPGAGKVNEDPAWSPDGKQLVFQSNRDGNYEIYVMDIDGKNQRRLTEHKSGEYWPDWSQVSSNIDLPIDKSLANNENGINWYDARILTVEGKGWNETEAFYDRFPAKAKTIVRTAVWELSKNSAGICVRFRTSSAQLNVRWKLTSPQLAMPHMPATGVSGVDLYCKTSDGWRWVANGRPTGQTSTSRLASSIPGGAERDYLLYLPLYNGVTSVEIGIPENETIKLGSRRDASKQKPIVFYGTSITQGGCASRPGMVHTAILGRWFDREVINLGFSGNGRMEREVAALMQNLDPVLFVIDCLPNIQAEQVRERTAILVNELRKSHKETPILLVEDRNYTNNLFVPSNSKRNMDSQAALKHEFEKLARAGDRNLHYLSAKDLLGDDGEGTVDSSHPTDLGFFRQAKIFKNAFDTILK